MTSYLFPYTGTQKSIAAFLRRMLRDAVTEYSAANAKFLGPQAAPQIGVQMIPHIPDWGIEEFRLGPIVVEFRNDPPTKEELAYEYVYPPKYEDAMRRYIWDVRYDHPMTSVEAELFETLARSVFNSLELIPNQMVHIEHKDGVKFTIRPLHETEGNWRAVVTLNLN